MERWRLVTEEGEDVLEIEFSQLGDILSKESALAQAAQALDIVAQLAISSGDNDALIKVAAMWADISDRLTMDQQDGGNIETPGTKEFKVGFSK